MTKPLKLDGWESLVVLFSMTGLIIFVFEGPTAEAMGDFVRTSPYWISAPVLILPLVGLTVGLFKLMVWWANHGRNRLRERMVKNGLLTYVDDDLVWLWGQYLQTNQVDERQSWTNLGAHYDLVCQLGTLTQRLAFCRSDAEITLVRSEAWDIIRQRIDLILDDAAVAAQLEEETRQMIVTGKLDFPRGFQGKGSGS